MKRIRPAITETTGREQPVTMRSIREAIDACAQTKPAAITFAVSASPSIPQGYGSLTRMDAGETKVIWIGRLADLPEFPAGAKLWLHRDDYERLTAATTEVR